MNPPLAETVAILREFPTATDEEILQKLLAIGCERTVAARLVEFVPIAYCRLLLAESGVSFSNRFQRKLVDGSTSAEQLLDAEPIWAEAVSFAEAEKRAGVVGKALLLVAARSSEFDAVNQLANRGTKLNDIVLSPTVFLWREDGPPLGEDE